MRNALLSFGLVIAILGISSSRTVGAQSADVTGVWLATDVPYAPWVFDLKQEGTTLTGSTWQSGAVQTVAPVYEGAVNGNELSFKVNGGTGGTITFKGTRSGETISFARTSSNVGTLGDGLYGAAAAAHITVNRMPPGSAPPPKPAGANSPVTLTTAVRPAARTAVPAITGGQHFVATTGVAFAPWTFDLKIDGSTVTGVVGQAQDDPASGYSTTLVGPFEIYDGKANGNTIDFKAKTSDGGRIVSFHGTKNGDEIAFMRSVEIVRGDPGRDGILGGSGATQFTAGLNAAMAPATFPRAAAPSANASPSNNLPVAPSTPTGPAGRWQVASVQNAPWTFEFTVAGTVLTGTIAQTGVSSAPVSIAAGKVDGTTISFRVLSPDAERIVAFNGRVNGNQISFTREITPLPGGSRGGNDLYGGSAPLQFIANRAAANRFNFKNMSVDVSSIQSLPNRDAILDSLRGQIDLIDAAITDPALKSFVQSIPLVMAANPTGADNAAYTSSTKTVMLTTASYSPEKPVVLHELMHAYHDLKLANGFNNAEIQKFYQEAKTGGQFPAGSYMLSNVAEYFAMMSSVYLHGSAARDPNTRQEIQLKQPNIYQWLEKQFGPR